MTEMPFLLGITYDLACSQSENTLVIVNSEG